MSKNNNNIDIHVGQRLKARRTMMGLSQEAVAKAVGITFQQVQKYEKGANAMNASRLTEFARFMNVPVAYFFDGFDDKLAAGGFSETATATFEHCSGVSNRESLEMMKAFNRIADQTVRKRLADLVRAIADNKLID